MTKGKQIQCTEKQFQKILTQMDNANLHRVCYGGYKRLLLIIGKEEGLSPAVSTAWIPAADLRWAAVPHMPHLLRVISFNLIL